MDVYEQWKGFESNGQFRFTPPTHSIIAFNTALDEFINEGGAIARNKKYSSHQKLNNSLLFIFFLFYFYKNKIILKIFF